MPALSLRYLNKTCNKINDSNVIMLLRFRSYFYSIYLSFFLTDDKRNRMNELVTIRLCQYISTLKAHSISREKKNSKKNIKEIV